MLRDVCVEVRVGVCAVRVRVGVLRLVLCVEVENILVGAFNFVCVCKKTPARWTHAGALQTHTGTF